MSRREAIDAFGMGRDTPIPHGVAVVSITTPEPQRGSLGLPEFDSDALVAVLHEQFDDVLPGEDGAIEERQGAEIVEFVRMLAEDGRCSRIVVHCDGGVSRSAGVAAAIGLLVGNGDSFVFDDPRLCPNMGCFRAVLRAAGADVTDKEADELELRNERLWRAARCLET